MMTVIAKDQCIEQQNVPSQMYTPSSSGSAPGVSSVQLKSHLSATTPIITTMHATVKHEHAPQAMRRNTSQAVNLLVIFVTTVTAKGPVEFSNVSQSSVLDILLRCAAAHCAVTSSPAL